MSRLHLSAAAKIIKLLWPLAWREVVLYVIGDGDFISEARTAAWPLAHGG